MAKRSGDDRRISTRMADAESAGLPDDIDVTVEDSVYAVRSSADYKEEASVDADDAVPVWVLTLQPDDGESFDLIQSCGNIKRVVPSDDGTYLERAPGNNTAKGISNTCKAFYLLESMIDCDDSVDEKANDSIKNLVGMKWHLLRKPAPKSWSGLAEPEPGPDGRKARARTIETCSAILSLPWKKGSGKSAPKKKTEPVAQDTGDTASDEAQEIVNDLLQEDKYKEDGIKVKSLYKLVAPAAKKSDNKDAVLELVQDDEWVGHEDRPWLVEGDYIKNP